MSKLYVTFSLKKHPIAGGGVDRYAIKCADNEQALYIASDVNAIEGITHIRINKCGRIHKESKVYDGNRYFEKGYFPL